MLPGHCIRRAIHRHQAERHWDAAPRTSTTAFYPLPHTPATPTMPPSSHPQRIARQHPVTQHIARQRQARRIIQPSRLPRQRRRRADVVKPRSCLPHALARRGARHRHRALQQAPTPGKAASTSNPRTCARNASNPPSRASARSTSRATTLLVPSQIEPRWASRSRRASGHSSM